MNRIDSIKVFLLTGILLSLSFRAGEYIEFEAVDGKGINSFVVYLSGYSLYLVVALSVIYLLLSKLYQSGFYVGWISLLYGFSLLYYILRVSDSLAIYAVFGGAAAIVCIILSFDHEKDFAKLINRRILINKSINFFSILYCIINAYLFFSGEGFFQGSVRFSGTSFHPNQFGVLAAVAFVVVFCDAINGHNKIYIRILYALASVLLLMLIIASGSRGAILGLAVAMFFVALVTRISMIKITITILVMSGALLVYGYFETDSAILYERLSDTGDNRSEAFSEMVNNFLESPIIGAGSKSMPSENSILKSLAVGGIISGFPIIILYLWLLYDIICYFMHSIKNNVLYFNEVCVTAVKVLIFVCSNFDGYLFERMGFCGILILIFCGAYGPNYGYGINSNTAGKVN